MCRFRFRRSKPVPAQPHPDAIEPFEAQQQAQAAQLRADQRYEEAAEVAERLRAERRRNNFEAMFRAALRGKP